jgi:hypothetical protein
MSCSRTMTAYLLVVMKQKFLFSPPMLAMATAAICLAILAATNLGVRPARETMVSSATTASSVRAAGALITPTVDAGY